jgi:hypothetical protein
VGASLQFYVQPQSVAINEKIPNFQVKILDAGGHLCTACTDTITLGYYYGTGSLTDGGAGTMTRAAVEGVATFDNFSIDTSGIKQFSAASGALTTAYSNVFSIKSYGTASKLGFGTQPAAGASTDLTAWATQPTVRIEDSAGNLVVSDNSTSVTLSCVNPSSGCTLLGTTTITAVNGIATFTNLRTAETALTNVVLEATASSLTSTQSNSFNGNLGSPYSLTFSQQPGDAWSPQPKVQILDNQGHLVSNATDTVTMTCVSATGGACALTGTTSVAASSGVASFTDLGTSVNGLTNVVIKAASGTLVSAQSSAFDGAP